VPEEVRELLVTEVAIEKLGARNISPEESEQLLHNRPSPSATHGRQTPARGGC
jgi:hypothetical protein